MFTRLVACLVTLAAAPSAAAEFPKFERKVIDPNVGQVCYAVTVADVDDDGMDDIVAVTENAVRWYRAPDWSKHTIVEDQTQLDNVCIAPHDVDGDGKVDFALGAGWLHGKNTGTIQWLSRGKTLDQKWNVHFIGAEPWTHRMRWADVLGTGQKQLVVSPLNASEGRAGVRLTAFSIPENPRSDPWPRTVLDASLNKMHNHWHADVDGAVGTLTASEEGVYGIRKTEDGFEKQRMPGSEAAGEIKTGTLKGRERPFVVTIEPMHGTKAVVYSWAGEDTRTVIQDGLGRGHALWTADLDGDGSDEIVVGHSEPAEGDVKGPGVYAYDANADGSEWTRHVIDDGGIATEDAIAADLTGDGKPDILAGGRQTHNVVLYVNQGGSR